jgi:hypothetical protein
MNCPTCGAVNDVDARFCAECGAPLENEAVEAAKAGQAFVETDEDQTILSVPGEIASEAKTLAVDQVEVSADLADSVAPLPSEPKPSPPPTDDVPPRREMAGGGDDAGSGDSGGASGGDGGGLGSPMLISIGAIVVLGLCCCCCSVGLGSTFAEDITFFLYDISSALGL